MNSEIKEKWITRLNDPDTKKGKHCLRTLDGHMCCLGVLTDQYIQETGKGEWIDGTQKNMFFYSFETSHTEGGVLPREVMEWAGLLSYNPIIKYADYSGMSSLATLNDKTETFKEVSLAIKEQL